MIKSFKNEATLAVYNGDFPKGMAVGVVKVGRRKLGYLDAATSLEDLRSPPGNKLHALTRDREGQHAIWINDQYRICFRWTPDGPEDAEIIDYHD